MLRVKDIVGMLEAFAPPAYQESYDNAGLITGEPSDEVSGVLCCLDSTETIVEEAIETGCNMIVAHHPIVFSGLKSLTGKNYIERTLLKAIRNHIAIYAIHTNLDNVFGGVSFKMAEKLGLSEVEVLSPKKDLLTKLVTFAPHAEAEAVRQAMFAAGAGVIGAYDQCSFNTEGAGTFRGDASTKPAVGEAGVPHTENETRIEVILPRFLENRVVGALTQAHSYEEVAYDLYPLRNSHPRVGSGAVGMLNAPLGLHACFDLIKEKFGLSCIRHTGTGQESITRIAVCGGSGSFLLNDAKRAGAQLFITADYKYHQFFDADSEIVIADIGHFESEQCTIELLHNYLTERTNDHISSLKSAGIAEKFDNFAVRSTQRITNPVKYY